MKRSRFFNTKKQSGVALIVGLLLLLILTILAVSGMSASNLQLIMAGNSQFHQTAFQAAEAGIELGVRGPISSTGPFTTVTGTINGGSYSYTPAAPFGNVGKDPPPGFSGKKFEAVHFEIKSTGSGGRGSVDTHIQGFYQITMSAGEPGNDPNACTKTDALLGTRASC
jgi:type IV pilus assembly protein PilX